MNLGRVKSKLCQIEFLQEFLDEKVLKQFKRYVICGFSSFALEYALFTLLLQIMKLWYIVANSIAYVIIFWFNFLLNRYWSFESKADLKKQLVMYSFLFLFNIAAQNTLMYVLSDMAQISPQISKVLIMGAVVSWNFIIYKKIIYR